MINTASKNIYIHGESRDDPETSKIGMCMIATFFLLFLSFTPIKRKTFQLKKIF